MTEATVQYVNPARAATPAAAGLSDSERVLLTEIERRVAAQVSTEAIIDFLFEATHDLSPCDRVSIAFTEEQGHRLVAYYTRSTYQPTALNRGYAEDLRQSSLAAVLDAGQVRIIHDLEAYAADHPDSRSTRLLLEEGVRSSLTCPLVVDRRIVGVLFRSARKPHAYTAVHARLHGAIGESLAPAVEKTYRIERLEQCNRAYLEMLMFVGHELKSPIAALLTSAQLLRDGYLGDLNDKQTDAVKRLVGRGRHVLELVQDYLELAEIEQGTLRLTPRADVDLERDVFAPVFETLQPQLQASRMTLAIDAPEDTRAVEVDPQLLRVAVTSLLSNALRFGFEGGEIRLGAARGRGNLEIHVWNTGPGFEPGDRAKLFRKFSRLGAPAAGSRGTGVGLYTVWRLIHLHGGHVDARSEPGEWAEFICEIPQPLPAEVTSQASATG